MYSLFYNQVLILHTHSYVHPKFGPYCILSLTCPIKQVPTAQSTSTLFSPLIPFILPFPFPFIFSTNPRLPRSNLQPLRIAPKFFKISLDVLRTHRSSRLSKRLQKIFHFILQMIVHHNSLDRAHSIDIRQRRFAALQQATTGHGSSIRATVVGFRKWGLVRVFFVEKLGVGREKRKAGGAVAEMGAEVFSEEQGYWSCDWRREGGVEAGSC